MEDELVMNSNKAEVTQSKEKKYLKASLVDIALTIEIEGKEVILTLKDFENYELPWAIDRIANDDSILKAALLKVLNK